jgi:hypothetical protein
VGKGGKRGRGDDAPRLLAAQSQHGYTDRIDRALREEPEAVSLPYQRRLSELAHRRDQQRRIVASTAASDAIDVALDGLLRAVGGDHRVSSRARLVRRSVAALGHEVRAQP